MQQLADVKRTARRTWATGDYDAMMVAEGLYAVGERLVAQVGVSAGQAVLDVACGTGNATIPAAERGARVTGLDLTPELMAVGQARAQVAGVQVDWVEGEAEQLPFDDGSFDVVLSSFGCMFAPDHRAAAREIVRVLRPGGRLAVCAWQPVGAIGEFFRVVAGYLPPSGGAADPPLRWGEEPYVRDLFDGTGVVLDLRPGRFDIPHPSVAVAVERYTRWFGPLVQAYEAASAAGRGAALRADLAALFERYRTIDGGQVVLPAAYLVTLGRRATG